MRYRLRAALGGVLGDTNLATLEQAEAEVFGSPGEKKSCASPVTVRVENGADLPTERYSDLVGHDPQKTSAIREGLA